MDLVQSKKECEINEGVLSRSSAANLIGLFEIKNFSWTKKVFEMSVQYGRYHPLV
jgi:hypothetical protein